MCKGDVFLPRSLNKVGNLKTSEASLKMTEKIFFRTVSFRFSENGKVDFSWNSKFALWYAMERYHSRQENGSIIFYCTLLLVLFLVSLANAGTIEVSNRKPERASFPLVSLINKLLRNRFHYRLKLRNWTFPPVSISSQVNVFKIPIRRTNPIWNACSSSLVI